MRATEFIVEDVAEGSLNEYRDQLWTWIQSKFPRTQWPEYVQRDFLYAKAKGNKNQKDLEDFLDEIQRDFGRVRWQLEKLPITLDIFTPKTQRMILSREGGSSNPYQVPKDAERHSLQQKMIQQKGVSEEPIIVAKLSNGYDLIEGWHRTIQHLKEFPQGYTAPAWVGYGATYTSESVGKGVAEGLEHADKLSGLVDLPVFPSSTNTSGTAKVVNTGDRIMAVLNVRGVNIPYYISTGGGGKASVPTGKWYPIFGRHSSGWLNKGGEDSINKSYGSNVLALGSSRLNNMLGDLSSMESQIPFMKKSGDAIINRDLQPMSYAEVSANPDEFKKRVNSFLAKLGSPPFYKVNATETQGISEGLNESLSLLVSQDQSERNEYKNFVKSQAGGDWSKGAKMYAQLKKRPSNDIFGDATRLNQFMKMKFDFDKFTDKDWDNYWLLSQHCDDNRDFQKNALSIIKKYQGTDHSHYKYLYDRISMGLTGKQKYGTQNVKEQGVAKDN